MKLEYELFEQLPSGPVRRFVVLGLYNAKHKLAELAETTHNECYAIHPRSKEVVSRANVPKPERHLHDKKSRKALMHR